MDPLSLYYSNRAPYLFNMGSSVRIQNRLNLQIGGSPITFRGTQYVLDYVTFSVPGSHTINFKSYGMEILLVHARADGTSSDPMNLVVSVPVQTTTGNDGNVVFASIFDFLQQANPGYKGSALFSGPGINPQQLLPANLDYFYYQGSMVTPPCLQSVEWVVLMNPIQAPARCRQIYMATLNATYAAALGAGNGTLVNARPQQPLNGRSIAYSGTPPFTVGGCASSSQTADYTRISFILNIIILATIGLGILAVIFLVNRHLRSQSQDEDNVPLHPLKE